MSSSRSILYVSLLVALVSSYCATTKELSTVFVLETSDSQATDVAAVAPASETSEAAGVTSTQSAAQVATEDSQSLKARSLEVSAASNTRIVTDDSPFQASSSSTSSSSESTSNRTNSSNKPTANQQHHQTQHNNQNNNNNNSKPTPAPRHHHQTTSTSSPSQSRRLTSNNGNQEIASESQQKHQASGHTVTRSTHNANTNANSNSQQSTSRPKSSHTNGNSRDEYSEANSSSIPKAEERLLISITSGDADDEYGNSNNQDSISSSGYNKQPNKLIGGSLPDQISSSTSQHQKRKPQITISIQDANIKQNGDGLSSSSSSSAVIVRPSQNGQSIVISTVGGGGGGGPELSTTGGHGGKHQLVSSGLSGSGHKPSISIIPVSSVISGGGGSSGGIINSNNEPPYREPVNIPITSSSGSSNNNHQIYPASSTHRPSSSLVNNGGNGNDYNSRPISTTLIDSQRPHSNNHEERPTRPIASNSGSDSSSSDYDTHPSSRPTLIIRPPTDSNYDHQGDREEPLTGGSSSGELRPVNNPQLDQQVSRFPLNEKSCGIMHETRIVGGEEANPDDFLWMAAIVKSRPKDGDAKPFCGGSLITRRHVLTAAHCLENLAPRDVLVRLGSYDFDDATASSLSADYAIDQFRVPAQYSKKTHAADIAIMRLKTPLSTNDNYKTVCMPQARRSYVGALGTVTGYGSQSQTFRRAAPKLRQVTVPIWENRKCSVVYKKNLTESFLCAGYEEGGKDACQGDSGGPLMTEGPNERMMVVGVVSHGIGCGSPGFPGVYTRTTTYLDWIEKNTKE